MRKPTTPEETLLAKEAAGHRDELGNIGVINKTTPLVW